MTVDYGYGYGYGYGYDSITKPRQLVKNSIMNEQIPNNLIQYALGALAIIVLLEKTIGIKNLLGFTKNLIRFIKPYTFTSHAHCNDPKLLGLVKQFENKNFVDVEKTLLSFPPDYRDFGLTALGEVEDESLIQTWIQKAPNHDLPKIILAQHKITQAWQARGVGFAKSVKQENMDTFKRFLTEAYEILQASQSQTSEFNINKDIALLTVYRGLNLNDRTPIHQTFQHGMAINPEHIGLHLSYFSAISPKWGGTEDELKSYLNNLPDTPQLLEQCILSSYYWDLVKIYDMDNDEKIESIIQNFIHTVDSTQEQNDNLYRFNLYLNIYWLSAVLAENLEDKYYRLVKPYWDDK